jgi:hypothetical protein
MRKYNALGHSTDMSFMAGPLVIGFGYAKGWSFKIGRWPSKGPQQPKVAMSFSFPGLLVCFFIEPMKAHLYQGQKQPILRKLWGWYGSSDQTWYYPK